MSKKFQLHIPTPCHENWEKMTVVEKGRFCGSCQKKVMDFSSMSDREIAMHFKRPSTGSVCGRFMEDQLNRDFEIERKRIPWVKYFFHFAIPAFLTSCDARSQGKVSVVTDSNVAKTKETKEIIMDGVVIKRILGDTAQIEYPNDSVIAPVNIKKIPRKERSIILPEVGLPSAVNVNTSPLKMPIPKTPGISQNPLSFVGGVTVRIGRVLNCNTNRRSNPFAFIKNFFKDTASGNIRIYPNPIQSNSTLHIAWNKKEHGEQSFRLYNQSGQLVYTKEISVDEKVQETTLELLSLKAGSYFIKIISKANLKSYTEKLIIE